MTKHAHNFRDLTGLRFGRLTAIRYAGNGSNRSARWVFRCDCGTEFETDGGSVTRGLTRSCGCLRKETAARTLVRVAHKETGCVIIAQDGKRHIFATRKEAAEWMGVCPATVTRHAGGKYKSYEIV